MRIVGIRERPVRISRYRDPRIPSGGLTTSLVAVVTDVVRAGRPVAGYGFASVGRYASGGYPYPEGDIAALSEEIRYFAGLGFTQAKIKIGGASLDHDLRRVEAAAAHLAGSGHLAAGAMNAYDPAMSLTAATALARFGLWWFEDICDPLDFATHARVAARYDPPIAAGEALFSAAEAALPDRHAGLRHDRDILLFDPVHCYGLPGYRQIIDTLTAAGRPSGRTAATCSASTSPPFSASAAPRSTRWPSTRSTAHRPPCQSTPAASASQTFPESVSNSTTTHGRPSDHLALRPAEHRPLLRSLPASQHGDVPAETTDACFGGCVMVRSVPTPYSECRTDRPESQPLVRDDDLQAVQQGASRAVGRR